MGYGFSIQVPSCICKWNEFFFSSCGYIFFRIIICLDHVPKEMKSCIIASQLEKFSFLVGNKMEWNEICHSHSRPIYVSRIKKSLILIPKFFYGIKICSNLIPSRKIIIPIDLHQNDLNTIYSFVSSYLHWYWYVVAVKIQHSKGNMIISFKKIKT